MSLDILIESILFSSAEPLSLKRLSEVSGADENGVHAALGELKRKLAGRGVMLIEHEGSFALATVPESTEAVKALAGEETEREPSKGALEVLSLIAYQAPVTQSRIEMIRGTNSQSALRQLMIRGLVERSRPSDAAPYEYRPTLALLQHLGIDSIASLPEYASTRAFFEKELTQE